MECGILGMVKNPVKMTLFKCLTQKING